MSLSVSSGSVQHTEFGFFFVPHTPGKAFLFGSDKKSTKSRVKPVVGVISVVSLCLNCHSNM